MESAENSPAIESDALRANLLETATEVTIDGELLVLLEVVQQYQGLHATLEKILFEVCHRYRNWKIILPQLRSFAVKNCHYYHSHALGPQAFACFSRLFLVALQETVRDSALFSQAVAALMAWLDKMVGRFTSEDLSRYGTELNQVFRQLAELDRGDRQIFLQVVQGQQPIAKIAKRLLGLCGTEPTIFDFLPLARLLQRMYLACYGYWLREDDPLSWFLGRCAIAPDDFHSTDLFHDISHQTLERQCATVRGLELENHPEQAILTMLDLPEHIAIVKSYRAIPNKLVESESAGKEERQQQFNENRKLLFLFKIMDTTGLSLIHEETLREINRSLVHLVRQQSFEEIEEFLLTTFKLLKANVRKFPHTSLQCIQVLGGEVFDRGNSRMVEAFLWGVVRFDFQHARMVGIDKN